MMTEDELRAAAEQSALGKSDSALLREIYAQGRVAAVARQAMERRLDRLEADIAPIKRYIQWGRGGLWVLGGVVTVGSVLIFSRQQVAEIFATISAVLGKGGAP